MRFMLKPLFTIISPDDKAGKEIISIANKISQFSVEDRHCISELWDESLSSKTDPERYHFLVAEKEEKIVGFACYGHRPLTQGTYDFYWLGVDPAFQHQGIGHGLMNAVEDEIKAAGGYIIFLETSSLSEFDFTREAYDKFGYQHIADIPDFYKPGDGLVIYIKRL
jgi:ribosomal protein S18 acetylase RimI-like enzyme